MIMSTEQAIEIIKEIANDLQSNRKPEAASILREAGLWLASDIEMLREYKFMYESVSK